MPEGLNPQLTCNPRVLSWLNPTRSDIVFERECGRSLANLSVTVRPWPTTEQGGLNLNMNVTWQSSVKTKPDQRKLNKLTTVSVSSYGVEKNFNTSDFPFDSTHLYLRPFYRVFFFFFFLHPYSGMKDTIGHSVSHDTGMFYFFLGFQQTRLCIFPCYVRLFVGFLHLRYVQQVMQLQTFPPFCLNTGGGEIMPLSPTTERETFNLTWA